MSTYAFLHHPASAVAAEIKAFDWSRTSLGPIETWPASLKTTIANMLATPTAMFLAWGPDLLPFYNDAYKPILGYRASNALGVPFQKLWESLWSDIEPLVTKALAGRSVSVADMRLDVSRAGVPEESYWSFTYSPAYDDAGQINGMLCVTRETTRRVQAVRDRIEADERLDLALSAGDSIGTWDWDVIKDNVRADARFAVLYGVDPDLARDGAPIAKFFQRMHPDDIQRVQDEIQVAMAAGDSFKSEYRLVDAAGQIRWVAAQGRCILNEAGKCIRLPGVSIDITGRIAADLAVRAAKEERDFVIDLTIRQRNLSDPQAVIRLALDSLGRRLGVTRAGFYRLVGADRMHHLVNWNDGVLAPLLGEHPTEMFGQHAARERARGRALVFTDSRHAEDGKFAPYAAQGVLSAICVPLMEGARWAAGVYLHSAAVREWRADEISLVKEVAGLTWVAAERAEALARLNARVHEQQMKLIEVSDELATQLSSRQRAEQQLAQLQKMEAVGQLTGGIAHDFNNMLAVIISGLGLAQRRLSRGDADVATYISGAIEGANKAAAMTQRLLAFSRQQPLAPEAIDSNRLVFSLTDLLTRSIGETVRLETVLGAGLWKARVDPNQLEAIIVNLAVNGRDAMENGGRLTIETANVHVDDAYAAEVDMQPGQYVMIAVSDTGTGMSPEVLAKAFEPFFTTKPVGKGTGLGLSQVYGFVRQSGGHVAAYSEVGLGTSIKLYLPRHYGEETPAAVVTRRSADLNARPGETVLIVEDEVRVRAMSIAALQELGYRVIEAKSGSEALDAIRNMPEISLLFTDIVMPGMTGRQLVDAAAKLRPTLKVLYTTGYTRNAVVHNGVLDPGTNFLPKPFSLDQLGAKVREVLDR